MWVIETIVGTGYENDPLHLCTKVDRLNFIHMEIKEIKALLSIETVLRYYNLKPDKNDRLHCPFHPDKTPSLQIYPRTNTFCCFSSNCTAGTGD
jgi:CHC2 zinc finger